MKTKAEALRVVTVRRGEEVSSEVWNAMGARAEHLITSRVCRRDATGTVFANRDFQVGVVDK